MAVYIDVIFFMNLMYQLGLLYITATLLHLKAKALRMIVAAAITSGLYCISIVIGVKYDNVLVSLFGSFLLGTIAVFIAYVPMKKKRILNILAVMYAFSFLLAGVLELLSNLFNSYFMITALGAILFLSAFCLRLKRILTCKYADMQSYYNVILKHRGIIIETIGILDTGNSLKDPLSGKPVVILEKDVITKVLGARDVSKEKGYRIIPYHSIGKKCGVLEAFYIDKISIKAMREGENNRIESEVLKDDIINQTQVLCAVYDGKCSTDGAYHIILHPLLL